MPFIGEKKDHPQPCPKCGGKMQYQNWESSDGAHDDVEVTCGCGYVKWYEGSDA